MIIFRSVEGKEDKTPLYYAAMAGKHEIVAYLLSITGVSPDNKTVCAFCSSQAPWCVMTK